MSLVLNLDVMVVIAMTSHLFIMLYDLLLGLGDDALQLVKPFLHFGESHASRLLLAADALQKFLPLFLSDARALLPLLNALRQDLADATSKKIKVRNDQNLSDLLGDYNADLFPVLLGSELHTAAVRAVFGVDTCSFDTSGSETLSGPSAVSNLCPLAVSHPVPVLLFGFVLPGLILLFLTNRVLFSTMNE